MAVNTAVLLNKCNPVHQPHQLQLHLRDPSCPTAAGARRPSRFKTVRFKEYRMEWGGAASAASVSDVYVMLPDRCALAAAAVASQETKLDMDARLPDTDLISFAKFAVCNCQPRRRLIATSLVTEDPPAVAEVSWTRQPLGCRHTERCLRRAFRCRVPSFSAASEDFQHHGFVAPPLPPLPVRQFSSPSYQSVFLRSSKKATRTKAMPSPSSPIELRRPSVPPPTPTTQLPIGLSRAESCAEICATTVAHMLQGVLLAAVRAETEPLERQLADKEAELCRLRRELRERDVRLRRLLRLLAYRGHRITETS